MKGEVGRQIQFIIWRGDQRLGIITGGSAAFEIACRDEFFGVNDKNRERLIQRLVQNTVCRMVVHERGLMQRVLSLWVRIIPYVWFDLYSEDVVGFETTVEPGIIKHEDGTEEKRDGHNYKGANWKEVGMTAGSAKRVSGAGNKHRREETSKKLVFVKKVDDYTWMTPLRVPEGNQARNAYLSTLMSRNAAWRLQQRKAVLKSSWKARTSAEKHRAKWITKRRKHLRGAGYFLCRTAVRGIPLMVCCAARSSIAGANAVECLPRNSSGRDHKRMPRLGGIMRPGGKTTPMGNPLQALRSELASLEAKQERSPLTQKIARVKAAIASYSGGTVIASATRTKTHSKRVISPAGRKAMAAAARKMWAQRKAKARTAKKQASTPAAQ